nr:MAG TPA: hypothetical protein [Caudoviricetes sp.]
MMYILVPIIDIIICIYLLHIIKIFVLFFK